MARPGDKINCPVCGRESVAKLNRVMDGWRVAEERVVCALCGGVLPPAPASAEDDAGKRAAAALAETLGVAAPSDPVSPPRDTDACFCRDCLHYLRHPFVSRCLLHRRPTEPMADCPDFSPAPVAHNQPEESDV